MLNLHEEKRKRKKEDSKMNLQLAIKEMFEGNEVEVYWNDQNEPVMTIQQLANSLGYTDRSGVDKIVQRNQYLDSIEFSVADKLSSTDGKKYDTRIFNEDGIYEITMLSTKPKAKEFRSFVRKLIKGLRKGEMELSQPQMDDTKILIQNKRAEATLLDARTQQAEFLEGMVSKFSSHLSDASVQSLLSHSTYLLTGENLIPKPRIEEKHHTAKEIGVEIGKTKQMVGRVANKHQLKQEAYGIWVNATTKKDEPLKIFLYNDEGKERLKGLLG